MSFNILNIGNVRLRLTVVLAAVAFNAAPAVAKSYRYQERTGDQVQYYAWEMTGRDPVTITSREPGLTFINTCRENGETLAWEMSGDEGTVRAVREGDRLLIKGHWQGATIDQMVALDGDPWYQALSFSLGTVFRDRSRPVTFWMIRPDEFSVHKLKAQPDKIEKLTENGVTVEAQRVRVSLTGVLSMVWRVDYWFRASDRLLVRYRGVHGPPGTPETVIRLWESAEDGSIPPRP